MKSEPSSYSVTDLERDGTTLWDGVRNYQVRNFMRDQMKEGDVAFLYHSSCEAVGIVGEMEVVGEAQPDPLQFDPKSDYFDAKSSMLDPRWLAVKVAYKTTFKHIITRDKLVSLAALKDSPLIKVGNRLSIIPLTHKEYTAIRKLVD